VISEIIAAGRQAKARAARQLVAHPDYQGRSP
jgi:hypothetical protein